MALGALAVAAGLALLLGSPGARHGHGDAELGVMVALEALRHAGAEASPALLPSPAHPRVDLVDGERITWSVDYDRAQRVWTVRSSAGGRTLTRTVRR